MKQIAQGAEAVVFSDGKTVVKHRFAKAYRHPELDKSIRQFRTRREGKVIARLNEKGLGSLQLISVDDKEMKITMTHLDGDLLKDVIHSDPSGYGSRLGALIGKLHSNDIIHGDITTSNVIDCNGELHFVDFGLSAFTIKLEDKAVELHLLFRALQSKHPSEADIVFEKVISAYLETYPEGKPVVDRYIKQVSQRGRNKKK